MRKICLFIALFSSTASAEQLLAIDQVGIQEAALAAASARYPEHDGDLKIKDPEFLTTRCVPDRWFDEHSLRDEQHCFSEIEIIVESSEKTNLVIGATGCFNTNNYQAIRVRYFESSKIEVDNKQPEFEQNQVPCGD